MNIYWDQVKKQIIVNLPRGQQLTLNVTFNGTAVGRKVLVTTSSANTATNTREWTYCPTVPGADPTQTCTIENFASETVQVGIAGFWASGNCATTSFVWKACQLVEGGNVGLDQERRSFVDVAPETIELLMAVSTMASTSGAPQQSSGVIIIVDIKPVVGV